jgi:hypothetical protein
MGHVFFASLLHRYPQNYLEITHRRRTGAVTPVANPEPVGNIKQICKRELFQQQAPT